MQVCLVCLAVVFSANGSRTTVVAQSAQPSTPSEKSYQFTNGQWFTGQGFHQNTFSSVGGRLTKTPPEHVDKVIDLAGGFVIPPFGEAHNHNVEGAWNIDSVIQAYLKAGVFYVKNPNNIPDFSDRIRHKLNLPTSIDVAFANGGLTSAGGWPVSLYEDVLRGTRYAAVLGSVGRGWFNNRAYFLIDTESDLRNKWPTITARRPDFIKTYLAHSEDFEKNRDYPNPSARQGLDPALLPVIVTTAHHNGLRVSTHVETATDFHHAVLAGVDEINHLPGWILTTPEEAPRLRISQADAQVAAQKHVAVVTTTVAAQFMSGGGGQHGHDASSHEHEPPSHRHPQASSPGNSDLLSLAREVQTDNLRLLHSQGVTIAIGSDHADTSLPEATNLQKLNVFDNLTLLKMWVEDTPRTIFPGRALGSLADNQEANFLVLGCNPVENFTCVEHIQLRVKQGVILDAP